MNLEHILEKLLTIENFSKFAPKIMDVMFIIFGAFVPITAHMFITGVINRDVLSVVLSLILGINLVVAFKQIVYIKKKIKEIEHYGED